MIPKKIKPAFFDALSNMTGRYVKPEPYHKAAGLVAKVYEQVVEEFFINGPTTTHAVCPPLLAGLWMAEREIMLTDDRLTREDKEALGVTFAQVNECTYCEDLINSVVYGANQDELADRMRFRQHDQIRDRSTRRLHQWAMESYSPDARIVRNAPFDRNQAPEVIGCALMFNYFNRYAKVFFKGTPLKAPFRSRTIKTALYKLTGLELSDSVTRRLKPGRSTHFLPPAELPLDMDWAAHNPNIANAVSRWSAAMEEAAEGIVPEAVRTRIGAAVAAWTGEPMPLSRSWLDTHTVGLSRHERASARLGLLTALSPSQMDDQIVHEFQNQHDGDMALVVTVGWAAFTASRRIARWLAEQGGFQALQPAEAEPAERNAA